MSNNICIRSSTRVNPVIFSIGEEGSVNGHNEELRNLSSPDILRSVKLVNIKVSGTLSVSLV